MKIEKQSITFVNVILIKINTN